LFSFKSGDITFGSPVGLRIGLSGSAAEVIEEKDPGGGDQHCKGGKMGDAGVGGHLISLECGLAAVGMAQDHGRRAGLRDL
jgi:hypothetical protein